MVSRARAGRPDLMVLGAAFRYDPSVVSVVDGDVQMLLAANPASQVNDQSLGDPGFGGGYNVLPSAGP